MGKSRASTFSFPFYPSDHMNDLNLRGCHPAAQGVWMSMVCLMAQGKPFGHLRIDPGSPAPEPPPSAGPNGIPLGTPRGAARGRARGVPGGGVRGDTTPPAGGVWSLPKSGSLEPELHHLIGQDRELTKWAVQHLESRNVFSRTADKIIFSRRMVRVAKEKEARVKRAQEAYARRQKRQSQQPAPTPIGAPGGRAPGQGTGTPSGGARGTPSGLARAGANGAPRGIPTGPPLPPPTTTHTPPDPPRKRVGPNKAAIAEQVRRHRA